MSIIALLAITVPFMLIGSVMAFLITWHEYEKHKFRGRRLFMEAFRAAVFTFIVFLVLSLFVGFVLTNYVITK